MEQPKRKVVVLIKKQKPPIVEPIQTPKKLTSTQLLALEGRRFYSFAWPKNIIDRLHIPAGIKPNDYVLAIVMSEVDKAEGRNNG